MTLDFGLWTLDFVCESQIIALQSSIFFSFKGQLFIKIQANGNKIDNQHITIMTIKWFFNIVPEIRLL